MGIRRLLSSRRSLILASIASLSFIALNLSAAELRDFSSLTKVNEPASYQLAISGQGTEDLDTLQEEAADKELPQIETGSEVHLIQRHKYHIYHSDTHHRPPSQYLIAVPPKKERKGIAEHLMIGVYSDFMSRYMSKELPDSKGPVWQPSATVEAYGFGLNVWSNFVLNSEPNQGEFNEVDFTPYYTAHIGNLTINPYVMFILFPNSDPASLDYSAVSLIEADIYLQYQIGKFDLFGRARTRVKENPGAVYAHVGVGFKNTFKCKLTLETSALLGMGNGRYLSSQYGPMETNIDGLSFMLAASWEAWKGFVFRPHINVAVHVVPEIRDAIRRNPNLSTYYVWGGLSLAYTF